MSKNPAKYEVLIKRYLRSILDMSGCELTVNKVQNKWKWVLSE